MHLLTLLACSVALNGLGLQGTVQSALLNLQCAQSESNFIICLPQFSMCSIPPLDQGAKTLTNTHTHTISPSRVFPNHIFLSLLLWPEWNSTIQLPQPSMCSIPPLNQRCQNSNEYTHTHGPSLPHLASKIFSPQSPLCSLPTQSRHRNFNQWTHNPSLACLLQPHLPTSLALAQKEFYNPPSPISNTLN